MIKYNLFGISANGVELKVNSDTQVTINEGGVKYERDSTLHTGEGVYKGSREPVSVKLSFYRDENSAELVRGFRDGSLCAVDLQIDYGDSCEGNTFKSLIMTEAILVGAPEFNTQTGYYSEVVFECAQSNAQFV